MSNNHKKIPVIKPKIIILSKKKLNETDYNKTRSTLESWCVMPHARQNLVTCGGGVMTKWVFTLLVTMTIMLSCWLSRLWWWLCASLIPSLTPLTRYRSCTNPAPQGGGRYCESDFEGGLEITTRSLLLATSGNIFLCKQQLKVPVVKNLNIDIFENDN